MFFLELAQMTRHEITSAKVPDDTPWILAAHDGQSADVMAQHFGCSLIEDLKVGLAGHR